VKHFKSSWDIAFSCLQKHPQTKALRVIEPLLGYLIMYSNIDALAKTN